MRLVRFLRVICSQLMHSKTGSAADYNNLPNFHHLHAVCSEHPFDTLRIYNMHGDPVTPHMNGASMNADDQKQPTEMPGRFVTLLSS